jgi:hypothetical protein
MTIIGMRGCSLSEGIAPASPPSVCFDMLGAVAASG